MWISQEFVNRWQILGTLSLSDGTSKNVRQDALPVSWLHVPPPSGLWLPGDVAKNASLAVVPTILVLDSDWFMQLNEEID